jgi:putative adhesin
MKDLPPRIGLLLLSATLVFLSGCKINLTKDYSIDLGSRDTGLRTKTFVNAIRIPDNTTTDRNLKSFAGSISVGKNTSVRNVKTVAGPISIGAHTSTRDLNSVAGSITIGEGVNIHGKVHTTAGSIHINNGANISKDVSSTAGSITLNRCSIEGEVQVQYGSLNVYGAKLSGGLYVKKTKELRDQKPTQINIGPDSTVSKITVAKNAFAKLRISKSAQVGDINGIEAEYY